MIIPQPNNRGGTGDVRISHAPLFLRKGGALHEKFLTEAPDAPSSEGTKLALEEVHDRAFRALGLVDEYLRVRENGKAIGRMTKDEHSDDEVIEALLFGDETAPSFSGLSKEVELECLAQEIRKILSAPQVRETFLTELSEESARYEATRSKLRTVSRMEAADDLAVKRMVQTYLKSKRHYGKLVQSSADEIGKLESARSRAAERASAERKSANETERGFLKAQRLLAYKEQIRSKGFALTPSRKALIRKISEHVLSGRKVFLVGSTGTGKTELAFYVADVVSGGYEIVSWHEGTTPRDLFGYRELSTDAHGNTVSGTKPGPVTKAVTDGMTVIQDEYTAGSTRSMLAAKAFMNAKPGQKIHIPGFNGDVFEVSEGFAEIFTGNPKDDKTKAREDMDPAILRMLTGLRIDYMPASEMEDVVLSGIIEDSGVLRLDPGEIELVSKLCRAAELMHFFHNREFFNVQLSVPGGAASVALLSKPFGDIRDSQLDKNFLDPGTLFSLFSDFDFTRAKRGDLRSHLERRLADFINDPKFDPIPEERELAAAILHVSGVTESDGSTEAEVVISTHEGDKGYLLPSELAKDTQIIRDFADPFTEEDETEIRNEQDETAMESKEMFDSEKEFERISEGRYYSPEAIDKILLEFSGGTVRL